MPKPRKQRVSIKDTPYYHCVSRSVRRAFLCGTDSITGESYEHRRSWLENKPLELPQVFAIPIAAYVIMSNHILRPAFVSGRSTKTHSRRIQRTILSRKTCL